MRSEEIVRSWKDETYRLSLSGEERALLPDDPAGVIELTDAELYGIDGGTDTVITLCIPSIITCPPMCITVLTFAPVLCPILD